MNEQDLVSLEDRMRARMATHPSVELRERVIRQFDLARRREVGVKLVATLTAVITIAVGFALSSSSPSAQRDDRHTEDSQPFAAELELDASEQARMRVLANARVPRIAPPVGSMTLSLQEGL